MPMMETIPTATCQRPRNSVDETVGAHADAEPEHNHPAADAAGADDVAAARSISAADGTRPHAPRMLSLVSEACAFNLCCHETIAGSQRPCRQSHFNFVRFNLVAQLCSLTSEALQLISAVVEIGIGVTHVGA